MTDHSRQALVGAIGGTYISLAVTDIDELTIANFALLNSADFDNPMQAVERYLKSIPRCPDMIGLAVDGTVTGDKVQMHHRTWSFNRNDVRAATGTERVHFVNDVEAVALSLPRLTKFELVTLDTQVPVLNAPKAVIGAGTGLGVAGLIRSGDQWIPVAGQGGNVGFPAQPDGEFDIRQAFPKVDFISAEHVFSGAGLVALYRALAGDRAAGQRPTPEWITKAGLAHDDEAATEALRLMAVWLGRFAGDMAALYGARGGIYLTGGLCSNIVPALTTGHFRDAFEAKGPFGAYLEDVPVMVIKTGADAGLRGAAVALAQSLPQRPGIGRLAPSRPL